MSIASRLNRPSAACKFVLGTMEEPTAAFRSRMNMMATPVSCISLHERDKIRVMNLADDAITLLRTVIQSSWSRGIQSERTYSASYEFKLNGNPWSGNSEEANNSRCLVVRILRAMSQLGWGLLVTTDITKHETDKDTMYFKVRFFVNITTPLKFGVGFCLQSFFGSVFEGKAAFMIPIITYTTLYPNSLPNYDTSWCKL